MASRSAIGSTRGRSDGDRRPDPRTFCGECWPWPLVIELADGVDVTACYIVREKRKLETRQNKPYLKLTLGDRSGHIAAHIWDEVEHWDPLCIEDDVVGVRGRVGVYQDRLQLKIQTIEPLRADGDTLERLLPATPQDRPKMERELDTLIASIGEAPLRALLRRCVGKNSDLGRAYRVHPAAKRNHHAYLAGLLEHSLSVAAICDHLAAHYQEQGFAIDRDLLVSGALLHDLGKLRELRALPSSGYTTEGQLLGHIVLGIQIITREAAGIAALTDERLLLLQHLVASHQGKPEWDSPKVPQLIEAMILHYADDLDAKLNQARTLLSGVAPGEWSAYDRSLERSLFQPPALPRSEEVEPVSSDEAVELLIDLFRS